METLEGKRTPRNLHEQAGITTIAATIITTKRSRLTLHELTTDGSDPIMKKLLGGLRQKPVEQAVASPVSRDKQQSLKPSAYSSPSDSHLWTGAPMDSSVIVHSARRSAGTSWSDMQHPLTRSSDGPDLRERDDAAERKSSWNPFNKQTVVSTALPSTPTSMKVFHQNVNLLMREVITNIQHVLDKVHLEEDIDTELERLCGFTNLLMGKLAESVYETLLEAVPMHVALSTYFESHSGATLCHESSFAAVALDFVEKMRLHLRKRELSRLSGSICVNSGTHTPSDYALDTIGVVLQSPMRFLMGCVRAIASNSTLVEPICCEVAVLLYLTGEDYPACISFVKGLASETLSAIPDKNFNAGLVWHLNDCRVITRVVQMMTQYAEAKCATRESAPNALKVIPPATVSITSVVHHNINLSSDKFHEIRDSTLVTESVNEDLKVSEERKCPVQLFSIGEYDPLPGFTSLVYILQKTCRLSLVLLEEFESSGGYDLLSSFLRGSSDRHGSKLIYLFTLLLPLGAGFSGASGENGSMVTVTASGARNLSAFLFVRDFALECMGELKAPHAVGDSKAQTEYLLLQILTTIFQVYTSTYENFIMLEVKSQTLAMMLSKFPTISFYDAQVIILRILEYACAAASSDSPLPVDILKILCNQFIEVSVAEIREVTGLLVMHSGPRAHGRGTTSNDTHGFDAERASNDTNISSTALLLCQCITNILQSPNGQLFREEFHTIGLLDRGVYTILTMVSSVCSSTSPEDLVIKSHLLDALSSQLSAWCKLVSLMLTENELLCVEFRSTHIHHSVYAIAECFVDVEGLDSARRTVEGDTRITRKSLSVFGILVELAKTCDGEREDNEIHICDNEVGAESSNTNSQLLHDGIREDIGKILELILQNRGFFRRQLVLVEVVKQLLTVSDKSIVWSVWRNCGGNEVLISVLSSLQDMEIDDNREKYLLMDAILEVLGYIVDPHCGGNWARQSAKSEVDFATVASCLITSGVLSTNDLPSVLSRVFEFITGQVAPRNKIRNANAVEALFCVLPYLSTSQALTSLNRLMSKITSNDDVGCSIQSQISNLVHSGIFRWIAQPPMINLLVNGGKHSSEMQSTLVSLMMELSREQLSTIHLREYLRVIARSMPLLLGNYFNPRHVGDDKTVHCAPQEEVGLRLLFRTMDRCNVPQTIVGTTAVATQMSSGYIHVINSRDRIWPPPNGYSFACWFCLPCSTRHSAGNLEKSRVSDKPSGVPVRKNTVSVALCEGPLSLKLHGDDACTSPRYGVLVGSDLSIYETIDCAHGNSIPEKRLTVTAVAANEGGDDFRIWSDENVYVATSTSKCNVEMWARALQQSESINNRTFKRRATIDAAMEDSDQLFVGDEEILRGGIDGNEEPDGFICLLSVYSLEFAGCYTRVYFDQRSGLLRVDTGVVPSGSYLNHQVKRTSVTFENVDVATLRSPPGIDDVAVNTPANVNRWHHLAVTHRKASLGSSVLVLYIDGSEVAAKKLNYPSAPGMGTMQAFIGKDIQICGTYPAMPWRVGPTWMTDDVLTSSAIVCMYLMGASFDGQFSGQSYRAIGEWPEAIATCQLYSASRQGFDANQFASRMKLSKLMRASQTQRTHCVTEPVMFSGHGSGLIPGASGLLDMLANKAEVGESIHTGIEHCNLRSGMTDLSVFVNANCAISDFGTEILQTLSCFKLPEENVIFSINTKFSAQQNSLPNSVTKMEYMGTSQHCPLDVIKVLPSLGGVSQFLFPLLDNAWRSSDLTRTLRLTALCIQQNPACLAECLEVDGYSLIASIVCSRICLVDESALQAIIHLAVAGRSLMSEVPTPLPSHYPPLVVDFAALNQIVLCQQLRSALPENLQLQLVSTLHATIKPRNPNAVFNARQLRRAGILAWIFLFIASLGHYEFSLQEDAALDARRCVPVFVNQHVNDILHNLLKFLMNFLRVENHSDDVATITDYFLLSMVKHGKFTCENPFRVVILQFLLDSIEADTILVSRTDAADVKSDHEKNASIAHMIINAVVACGVGSAVPASKQKGNLSCNLDAESSRFDNILVDVVNRTDEGPYSSLEAILALRILMSLAQTSQMFAQHLLKTSALVIRLSRGLLLRVTLFNMYTPLLAYVSNIPISETKYNDSATSMATITTDRTHCSPFALPAPLSALSVSDAEGHCVDQVWDLVASLLVHNCEHLGTKPQAPVAIVMTQIAFQIQTSKAFFTTMQHSWATIARVVVQSLVHELQSTYAPTPQDEIGCTVGSTTVPSESPDSSDLVKESCRRTSPTLQQAVSSFLPISDQSVTRFATGLPQYACFYVLHEFLRRALFDSNEFGSIVMLLIDCTEEYITRNSSTIYSVHDGRKAWLTLVVHVIVITHALSERCSLTTFKNVCTLCVALSRYLTSESKHQSKRETVHKHISPVAKASGDGGDTMRGNDHTCFGSDVLDFVLHALKLCEDEHLAEIVGYASQQFGYSCLVYCAQNIILAELTGPHRHGSPSKKLLECLKSSRSYFIQNTTLAGTIACNVNIRTSDADQTSTSTAATKSGITDHLNRMRNPGGNCTKEFRLGDDTDREFLLALAAELFRWLVDDSEYVQGKAIELWQFFLRQRFYVFKELLIVEPKGSLLSKLGSKQKETVDMYHGGFEKLLLIVPPQPRTDVYNSQSESCGKPNLITTDEAPASRETWLTFHIWLTDNYELLNDLVVTRAYPVFQHAIDVLRGCVSIRSINMTPSPEKGVATGYVTLNLEFPVFEPGDGLLVTLNSMFAQNADLFDQGEQKYRLSTRRALVKHENVQEAAADAIHDAQLRWRETLARLLNTRAIWHLGKWNAADQDITTVGQPPLDGDDGHVTRNVSSESFYLERTIFQQNSVRYKLDFTEGPQRRRLRLVRKFIVAETKWNAQRTESDSGPAKLPLADDENDTLDRTATKTHIEFHNAVSAFKLLMSKPSADRRQRVDILPDDLNPQSLPETVKNILVDVRATAAQLHGVLFSQKIYAEYLAGEKAALLNVSSVVADEICRRIASTGAAAAAATFTVGGNLDEDTNHFEQLSVPPSLFDVADLESMQSALSVMSPVSTTTRRVSVSTVSEEEEQEEAGNSDSESDNAATPDANPTCDLEQEPVNDGLAKSLADTVVWGETDIVKEIGADALETWSAVKDPNDASSGETAAKIDSVLENDIGGYTFESIARFLRREDYPPLRCYGASYITGVTKTTGVFLVCRNAIYFIGGYCKLVNAAEADITPDKAVHSANPASPDSQSILSPTQAAKRGAKNLIRQTFGDITLSFPAPKMNDKMKSTYMVVPQQLADADQSRSIHPTGTSASSKLATVTRGPAKRWCITYAHIKQFYRMKFQLRHVGIELFDTFGSTYFLQLESTSERDKIIRHLLQMPIVNSVFWNPLLRSNATATLSVKKIRQGLTKRWLKGQISNFEYLMHVNTLAGRSFNDLTQYPVFPWVLADYSSEFLDLEKSSTFRELSKPMGALGSKRAAYFCERFAAMDQENTGDGGLMETPAFHYGTHYSCSAYVVNFLVRMEPFAQLARDLQRGSFDHADRLFRSIPASWESASTDNLQDVRELIPEFYFLPEFLYNANDFDLGTTQSGDPVSHVALPPWAHGDPREFIRLHRRALESRYVSENLHHWIDLVFGYKQTGRAACAAQNVFMHVTYEGAVDIDSIEDPVIRNATLSQIENFGQTPSQLFSSPHPARKVPVLAGAPLPTAASTVSNSCSQLGPRDGTDDGNTRMDPSASIELTHGYESHSNNMESFIKWHTPLAPALVCIGKAFVFLKKQTTVSVHTDGPVRDVKLVGDRLWGRGPGFTFVPPRYSKYLEWGDTTDGTMKVRAHQGSARMREAHRLICMIEGAHHSQINCAQYSADGVVLVTGGDDAAVNVLECTKTNGQRLFKQLCKLVGHHDAVTCVAINKDFNLIVSGSMDGFVILWDLRTRTFLRELAGHLLPIAHVGINSSNGNVITATGKELRLWSINGDLLAATTMAPVGLSEMTCAISTRCETWQNGVVIVTGHSLGTIALWGLRYPADLQWEKRQEEQDDGQSNAAGAQVPTGSRASIISSAVRIAPDTRNDGDDTATPGVSKVIPSCRLFAMKLLVDHRAAVTALTLGQDQRQLFSADADGTCIRWVDDSTGGTNFT